MRHQKLPEAKVVLANCYQDTATMLKVRSPYLPPHISFDAVAISCTFPNRSRQISDRAGVFPIPNHHHPKKTESSSSPRQLDHLGRRCRLLGDCRLHHGAKLIVDGSCSIPGEVCVALGGGHYSVTE